MTTCARNSGSVFYFPDCLQTIRERAAPKCLRKKKSRRRVPFNFFQGAEQSDFDKDKKFVFL